MHWQSIETSVTQATGHAFRIQHQTAISGGSINRVYRIADQERSYFVKLNQAGQLPMFEAEAAGLSELASANAIRIPEVICFGQSADQSWLVTEYIEFGRSEDMQCLGRQLTTLHGCKNDQFGWFRDNTIGLTQQHNQQSHDWVDFYREQRLRFQLHLAARNGFTGSLQTKGESLMQGLDLFFSSYKPQPSLLHGDLWSGNRAFDSLGQPVIFDPAVYYGDREADIAMTELFGGFTSEFYDAYREAWPLDDGYSVRKTLYHLYHILNHANLFGGSYAQQAESMIDQLLVEL
ncbi:fructosamine kinase family protein [Mariprofundus sp. EBB-1]|nr:fructosamine kinase family protein [Mariprofundus sp. EBB-1]